MTLGDGIRRNIAVVDPSERALLREAFIQLNRRTYLGLRSDTGPGGVSVPGGVTFWFKQDEIHHATHVHHGPEFLSWHREIVNRLEDSLRGIHPGLSLHYWDWTQDPRAIPNANLGAGVRGTLNLFSPEFMGYGGFADQPIGEPWLSARYYVPGANPDRDSTSNPADPPRTVTRHVGGIGTSPARIADDEAIVATSDFAAMRRAMEIVHDAMHGYVSMGGQHISFRDPFVFLLHSNVDRLFALWQLQFDQRRRLDPRFVYGSESADPRLNGNVEPWSTGHSIDEFGIEHLTRPWCAPEKEGVPHTYRDPSVVIPRLYDTSFGSPIRAVLLVGKFRTLSELNLMSHDDHRNTLIVELVNRTNKDVHHYQAMDDDTLAGAGAVLVFVRVAGIRDDNTLKTTSDDEQRNTLIVEVAATGTAVPQLQAMNNLNLVATGLGRQASYIRGVLLTGRFRTWRELNVMSHDDHRNTLIVELVNRTNKDVGHFQGMDDLSLAGAGAVLVFIRTERIRDDETLKTMSDDDQRNTLIVEVAAATGMSGPQLQGMNSINLVSTALRGGVVRFR